MDVFSGLTDDQTALMGCAAALLVCGGVLWLSLHVGRLLGGGREPAVASGGDSSRQPQTLPLQSFQSVEPDAPRRAA